jgi:hypothetical protein
MTTEIGLSGLPRIIAATRRTGALDSSARGPFRESTRPHHLRRPFWAQLPAVCRVSLQRWLLRRTWGRDNDFPGVSASVHRMDRLVSGHCRLAGKSASSCGLAVSFRQATIRRRYVCVRRNHLCRQFPVPQNRSHGRGRKPFQNHWVRPGLLALARQRGRTVRRVFGRGHRISKPSWSGVFEDRPASRGQEAWSAGITQGHLVPARRFAYAFPH